MIDPVMVYLYTYWDADAGQHKTSTMYATRDVILSGLGNPVGTSGMKVERADLRDMGFYVPPRDEPPEK